MLQELPVNKAINESPLGGVTCAPPGFVFIYGIGTDPPSQGYSHKCVKSWQVEGGTLCYRIVCPKREMDLLFLPITESGDPCEEDTKETWWQSLFGILVPSAGVYVNRDTLRNLSATIGQMVEETARSTAAQQKSLDSLAQVV